MRLRWDAWLKLPDDVWTLIMEYVMRKSKKRGSQFVTMLGVRRTIVAASVCKRFHTLCSDNRYWRQAYKDSLPRFVTGRSLHRTDMESYARCAHAGWCAKSHYRVQTLGLRLPGKEPDNYLCWLAEGHFEKKVTKALEWTTWRLGSASALKKLYRVHRLACRSLERKPWLLHAVCSLDRKRVDTRAYKAYYLRAREMRAANPPPRLRLNTKEVPWASEQRRQDWGECWSDDEEDRSEWISELLGRYTDAYDSRGYPTFEPRDHGTTEWIADVLGPWSR